MARTVSKATSSHRSSRYVVPAFPLQGTGKPGGLRKPVAASVAHGCRAPSGRSTHLGVPPKGRLNFAAWRLRPARTRMCSSRRRRPVTVLGRQVRQADLGFHANGRRTGGSVELVDGGMRIYVRDWWHRQPIDWIARRICRYLELAANAPDRCPRLLTGQVAGYGPDHEPPVVDIEPIAWVGRNAVEQVLCALTSVRTGSQAVGRSQSRRRSPAHARSPR
jgi:hypothetical protein